jgi:hypothetical protein
MLRSFYFLLGMMLLSSCSLYSSAGRKQFEEKAPSSIQTTQSQKPLESIQSYSLQSCREMSSAETWFREEFPNTSHELIEMHPDYEVWGVNLTDGQVEITVISQDNAGTAESCVYKFESKKIWQIYKKSFLEELSRSLANID